MQKSKFWVINKIVGSLYLTYKEPYKLCLSEEEAEFHCKRLNSVSSIRGGYYTVSDIEVMDFVDKNSKEYKKFLDGKKQEIMEQISKKEECKNQDTCAIECLKTKLNELS